MYRQIRLAPVASIVALASLLWAAPAQAAGVGAGTLISNTATATYTSGGTSTSIDSNTVTLRVDELLDVAVAGAAGGPVAVSAAEAALPFTVTNTGNGPEAFALSVNPAVVGNQFDASLVRVVIDANDNDIYEPGIDTVLPSGAQTPLLAADQSLSVFVIVTLPAGASDGQTGQLRLTATAATGSGSPGTAYGGLGQGGGDAVVGLSGASDDGLDAIVASAVTVALTKSATIVDPLGGSRPLPGALVTYTIVAAVTGSSTARSLAVNDPLPAGTSYQSGTMTLDGVPLSDAADADAGTASAAGIVVTLGDTPGSTSRTIRFTVKLN